MCLVVYTVEERQLLWFDCEVWDTSRRTGGLDSHEKLVRALGATVEDAGGTGRQERPPRAG